MELIDRKKKEKNLKLYIKVVNQNLLQFMVEEELGKHF